MYTKTRLITSNTTCTHNQSIYIILLETNVNHFPCKYHTCDTVISYKVVIYYNTDLYSRLALLYNHKIQLLLKICITTGICTIT